MKNIFKLCQRDIKTIFTNSMAIILSVGIALLPSLYAWFNIYANWDPYGSTGNMQIAVINNDEGTTVNEIKIDIGSQIVSNLKSNDTIDWQFLSKDEALSGIESGKYYACIEIPSGFSQSFTSIMTTDFKSPEIIYYANEKKNAIATKITDKVVQVVQTEVNESFIITIVNLINQIFGTIIDEGSSVKGSVFNDIRLEINETETSIKALKTTLNNLKDILKYVDSLDNISDSKSINSLLSNTDKLIDNTQSTLAVAQACTDSICDCVNNTYNDISYSITETTDKMKNAGKNFDEKTKALISQELEKCKIADNYINNLIEILQKLNALLTKDSAILTKNIEQLKNAERKMQRVIEILSNALSFSSLDGISEIEQNLADISALLSTSKNSYNSDVKPKLDVTIDSLALTMNDVSNIISSVQKDMPDAKNIADSLNNSVKAGDSIIASMNTLIDTFSNQLSDLSDKMEKLENSELVNTTINLISQNADDFGEFFACPVKVTTDKVYGIENYGSAMAPFYTTLAIWVGGTILVAVLKTNVKNKKDFRNFKPYQEYFGRGMTFILFSVIQSTIICAGDLLFLKIQCYHPIKFILAGIIGSVVIMFFIYTLAYTFGDIGKALAVIMLVVQIGGSGGTFPIDVTPPFFRSINPYLPFTFVIEAMRECICGSYENAFWIYLLKLCAYIAVSLIIGLGIKAIVKKPITFFNKQVEKTGLF